jgi:hypothetical protein
MNIFDISKNGKSNISLGKMKDDTARKSVQEFVGFRSKMYSLKYEVIVENDLGETLKYFKDKKTAKGLCTRIVNYSIFICVSTLLAITTTN